jgi:hypothetical protein
MPFDIVLNLEAPPTKLSTKIPLQLGLITKYH